jgi:hypothetical protein
VANIYECDPSLDLFVQAAIDNGHTGAIELSRPALGSAKERLARALGAADPLRNTSVILLAAVVVKNAKGTSFTVDVFQRDAAGAVVNQRSFSASRPRSASKKVTLRCYVEIT